MILRRLHLHPFAGSADRELSFAPGLNVVLGPNEAGKSTLRRALRQALFVSTKLTKREAEREVKPHLPLTGGDTLRVSVELDEDGSIWTLAKQWAAGASTCELRRPDGGIVSDAAAVDQAVAELLGLTRGTWEHVLIAAQGEVGASLDRLDSGDPGDLDELSKRLRRAAFETDGVSIEKLGAVLEARREAAFGRWDRTMKRPEGNRGLDQRWARGAGSIVNAWYEREAARSALEQAEGYYRRLDEINAALEQALEAKDSLDAWIAGHESAARDAEQRVRLEAELAAVEAQGKGMRQASQEWPVAESQAKERETLAAALREKAVLLGQELARVQAWEAAGKTRRLLEEAERLASAVETARQERDAVGAVEGEAVSALESLEKERDRLRARIEAATLRVRLAAARALRVETHSGLDDAETHELGVDGELEFEAGGRVLLREASGAWEIEVSSGGIDAVADTERHHALGEELAERLAALGVADLAAAKAKRAAYLEKAQRAALLEGQLAEALGSRSLAELRAEAAAASGGEAAPSRSGAEVAAEKARAESEAAAADRETATLRRRITAWVGEFGSLDELIDRLADLRGGHRKLKERHESLQPLPEGCVDAESFLRDFRAKRESLDEARAKVNRLLVEKAELSRDEPDEEPAAAAERHDLASAAFARALREGEAIERIQRDYEALRAELDGGTLAPWREHLAAILAPLTHDRYLGLSPEEGTASRGDGTAIPFALLSAGTRASLGLALRLSMARWFLEGRDGFLLLDDPLVDLDPRRQEAAAAMLRRFAEEKQVVVFTCHPAHAERLGGRKSEI